MRAANAAVEAVLKQAHVQKHCLAAEGAAKGRATTCEQADRHRQTLTSQRSSHLTTMTHGQPPRRLPDGFS